MSLINMVPNCQFKLKRILNQLDKKLLHVSGKDFSNWMHLWGSSITLQFLFTFIILKKSSGFQGRIDPKNPCLPLELTNEDQVITVCGHVNHGSGWPRLDHLQVASILLEYCLPRCRTVYSHSFTPKSLIMSSVLIITIVITHLVKFKDLRIPPIQRQ